MWYLWMGLLGFVFFFLHDTLQIKKPAWAKPGYFTLGLLLLILATAGLIRLAWRGRESSPSLWMLLPLAGSLLFLYLLVHALFFALPSDTYQDSGERKQLVSTGVYALCRHPGILWFAALYLCLWLAFGSRLLLAGAVMYALLNLLYAYLQDRWVFPRQFEDYERYQKETPFLLPSKKSLSACIKTWRSRNGVC